MAILSKEVRFADPNSSGSELPQQFDYSDNQSVSIFKKWDQRDVTFGVFRNNGTLLSNLPEDFEKYGEALVNNQSKVSLTGCPLFWKDIDWADPDLNAHDLMKDARDNDNYPRAKLVEDKSIMGYAGLLDKRGFFDNSTFPH